jgi:hypothetical protein
MNVTITPDDGLANVSIPGVGNKFILNPGNLTFNLTYVFGLTTGNYSFIVSFESSNNCTIVISPSQPDVLTSTFDIEMSNGSCVPYGQPSWCPATVSDDGDSIFYPLYYDSGTNSYEGSVGSGANTRNSGAANFSIKPLLPPGIFDSSQLPTIYFSFDEESKYENKAIFDNAEWRINGVRSDETTIDGSHTMLLSDTDWIELRWQLNDGNDSLGDVFGTLAETISCYVTFSNGDGWIDTYELQWIILGVDT